MSERPDRCLLCEARLSNPVCQLSASSVKRFAEVTRTMTCRAGETVFSQGDRAGEIFVVRSGKVKITYEHPDGAEQVLRLAGPGEILGIAAAPDGTMSVTASARNGSTFCRTRMVEVESLVQRDPDFALAWAHLLMDEVKRARGAVFHLGPHPAGVRLARFLVQTIQDHKSPKNPLDAAKPCVSLTHADVAASLSIAQETATRLLGALEEKGVVRLSRGKIEVLDMDRLLALSGFPGSEVDLPV